jgi:preprotein translocase subunit SecF
MQFLTNTNFDFMKYRRVWAVVSLALTVLSIVVIFIIGKLNIGIDFAGGTQVVVRFREAPDLDRLRTALAGAALGEVSVQRYGSEGSGEVMVRAPLRPGQEEGQEAQILAALDRQFNAGAGGAAAGFDLNQGGSRQLAALLLEADPLQLVAADEGAARLHYQEVADAVLRLRRERGVLSGWQEVSRLPEVTPEVMQVLQQRARLGNYGLLSQEVVGPTMGQELRQRGIWAVALSVLAMLAYIWVRFELRFGIGAVVAILHDVIVVLGLYAIAGFEFNLTTIAAFLTLVGYSVNDSVVVFDRVRETMRKTRRLGFERLLNDAINETLSRTLLTGTTTLAAMGALLVLGGEVLRGFAFVMVVGVVVGTYSSIWVASSFTLLWQGMLERRQARGVARADGKGDGKSDGKSERRGGAGEPVSSRQVTGSKEGKAAAGQRRR